MLAAIQTFMLIFYYLMVVMLLNANFIVTGYILPAVMFICTWIMVGNHNRSFFHRCTLVIMSILLKVVISLFIGNYRSTKRVVELFISQYANKKRKIELQTLVDEQEAGVIVV